MSPKSLLSLRVSRGSLVRRAGILALFVGLLSASPAAAASTTIGQLAPNPVSTGVDCPAGESWDVLQPTVSSGQGYVVPSGGTLITSWSTNANSNAGQMLELKVYRHVSGTTYTLVGHEGPHTLTATTVNTFAANIAVQPGDVIGLGSPAPAGATACAFSAPDSDLEDQHNVADGQMQTFTSYYGYRDNVTAMVQLSAPQPTLSASLAGTGSGTVTSNPAGISCPSTCSHSYAAGTMVTLTATPISGSRFAGWSGGGCSNTGSCTVTMSSDQSVTAAFTPAPKPTCTIRPATANVLLPSSKKNGHKKHKTRGQPGALSFALRCNQTAHLILTSKLTETLPAKGKHGKKHTKTFLLRPLSAAIQASTPSTLTIKLPTRALTALKAGARESVSVTLTVTNANGTTSTNAKIPRLKPVKR